MAKLMQKRINAKKAIVGFQDALELDDSKHNRDAQILNFAIAFEAVWKCA